MKSVIFTLLLGINALTALGQDDLLDLLEKETPQEAVQFEESIFKGSRLINGHTVVTRKKNSLEFLISHRFGRINSGIYDFFGLDGANVRFGLERGMTDRLTIGLGRNSFEKTYDGFVKYALLRQHTGATQSPVSITWFSSAAIKTLRSFDADINLTTRDCLAYSHVMLIARKFSNALSVQLMPSVVHRNQILPEQNNDVFALGAGARLKISKRVSFNAEYYQRVKTAAADLNKNSLALGFDIETGGHVFQLHFTNSQAMVEKGFIAETQGDFFDGDIHFGFNISRVFN